jgi:hypothetical protein
VLGVDGIVLDRRVEPEPVTLVLAVIEGRLERASAPAAAPASSPAAASASATWAFAVLVIRPLGLARALVGRTLLDFVLLVGGAQLRLDLGLDLVAQVDVAGGLLALDVQPVAAAEIAQLRGGHLELMGDPGVGAALADPGADLVELGSKRLTGHRSAGLYQRPISPRTGRFPPNWA